MLEKMINNILGNKSKNKKEQTRADYKEVNEQESVKTDFSLNAQMVQQRGHIEDSGKPLSIKSALSELKAKQEHAAQQIKEIKGKGGTSGEPRKQKRPITSTVSDFDIPNPPKEDDIEKIAIVPIINIQNSNKQEDGVEEAEFDSVIYNQDHITKDEVIFTSPPTNENKKQVNSPQKELVVAPSQEGRVIAGNDQAPLVIVEDREFDIKAYQELDMKDDEDYITNNEMPGIEFREDVYDAELLASLAMEEDGEEHRDEHSQADSFTFALLTYLDGTQRSIKVKGVYDEVTLDYDIDIMNGNKSTLMDVYTGMAIEIEPEHLKEIQFSDIEYKHPQ